MIDQQKDFKVRNSEGEYLSFDFDAGSGRMNPLWGPISMSYSFTLEEAKRLANIHGAEVVAPYEWKVDYQKFQDQVRLRERERFGSHTYYGNGRRR